MSIFENVTSSVRTPAQLVEDNTLFSIPSYQRPYVWGDEAIKCLFDDLYNAYRKDLPHYYVGTILTSRRTNGTLELIDGQQRTTTLMLLALACKKKAIDTELTRLICSESNCQDSEPRGNKTKKTIKKLRLVFNIRDQVEAYLGHMAGLTEYDNKFPGEVEVESNPYLRRLAGGLATFENLLDQIPHAEGCKVCKIGKNLDTENNCEQQKFANYVYNKMRLVNNQIPRSTDLNQLFATMNNSGVQLEQVDILKSLLFKKITEDKVTYNAIWQACENMNNYFERNVRQVFTKTEWNHLKASDFAKFDASKFKLKLDEDKDISEKANINIDRGLSIAEIVNQSKLETGFKENPPIVSSNVQESNQDDEQSEVYCTSIISFSQLLMHTYRIYVKTFDPSTGNIGVEPENLLKLFNPLITKNDDGEGIKKFIRCLWRVRFAFDRWVIKWVENAGEEDKHLLLSDISESPHKSGNSYYFNRTVKEHSSLSMLQMVSYFTSDRKSQYWLSPYLAWLINKVDASYEQVLNKLEYFENLLSLETVSKLHSQKSYSYILIDYSSVQQIQPPPTVLIESYFNKNRGVKFKHYWFQKLEYLLWKHRGKYFFEHESKKYKQYRIISRNSVEHVHPQKEEYENKLEDGYLDSFGNLALLNVSQNSSYSNQGVAKKRIDFESKKTYDSLKLKHIFTLMGEDSWDEEKIAKHKNEMVDLLKQHYVNTTNEN
ncbi:DUF262 domain-containing protein [Agaribacter flavus]|uniref:DUF262 domain-containing protein n=1 Tax=Agaribacter flavus TaxID=1902781 RepID=A0ABV7FU70_9ALTE